jgi:serine/threonine protein kinase
MPGLNNYRFVKKLSSGLVDTFIAENLGHSQSKYSVIKVFNLSTFASQQREYVANLLAERSAVISQIPPHPQIAQITNYFRQDTAFYLVETYISGHGIDVEVTPGKRLSESYAIAFLKNTLIPLEWLHQHNIVHGNIHPANLMRRQQDGRIILTDLGSVKQVWQGAINSIHPQPRIVKNIYYLPERERPTFTSDLYSLGAIAIQSLTGLAIEQLVNPQSKQLIWHHQPQINPNFSKVLARLIHPEPTQRYASARQVLIALETAKEDLNQVNQPTINISSSKKSAPNHQFTPTENSPDKTIIAPSMPEKSMGKLSVLAWVIANCAGISSGYYLSWVLAYLSSFLTSSNLVPAIFGFAFGLVWGTSQGLVIKGTIQRGCWWIGLTTLASSLGFFLGNIVINSLANWGGATIQNPILGAVLGLTVGLPQSLILRSQLGKGSGWWLVTGIAGAICALIATIIPGWGIAVGGIIFGVVTAIFLK